MESKKVFIIFSLVYLAGLVAAVVTYFDFNSRQDQSGYAFLSVIFVMVIGLISTLGLASSLIAVTLKRNFYLLSLILVILATLAGISSVFLAIVPAINAYYLFKHKADFIN